MLGDKKYGEGGEGAKQRRLRKEERKGGKERIIRDKEVKRAGEKQESVLKRIIRILEKT